MPKTKLLSSVAALALLSFSANAQTITTVAGGGPNNVPASGVALQTVGGVAVDSSGNVYIADASLNRVFKVSSGTLTVVAGNGLAGYGGDGGPATLAYLSNPNGVAVDAAGDLFIADTSNCRIREVNTSGTISTIAGNGVCGYNGDAILAKLAYLNNPYAVAVDSSGDVYIADTYSHRVRMVDSSGNIHTVAGVGFYSYNGDGFSATSAALNSPYGVAVDSSDNVYIADTNNCRIREVTGGIISTVAGNGICFFNGDGSATSSEVQNPKGIAVDSSGNLFIADTLNQRIREVSGGNIVTIGGNGNGGYNGDNFTATSVEVFNPQGVAVDTSDDVFVADSQNHRIRELTVGGDMGTAAGNGTSAACAALNGYIGTDEVFCSPQGVSIDGSGDLFIADQGANLVSEINSSGILTVLAGDGTFGFNGDGIATAQNLSGPTKAIVDSMGNVYIADAGSNRIRKVDTSGNMTTLAGSGVLGFDGDGPATSHALSSPTGIAFDNSGNLLIADYGNDRIRRVDAGGNMTTIAGVGSPGFSGDGGLAIYANLNSPRDVAVDSTGNIFIADSTNNRVRKVDTGGNITTVAGTGSCFLSSDGLAMASAVCSPSSVSIVGSGTIAVSEAGNARVRYIFSDGTIKTVAGDGALGFSGDGGSATNASLSAPYGIATDNLGDLWIADTGNLRVREVTGLAITQPSADLGVTMTESASTVLAGANVTYSIVVTNGGPSTATSVVVSDILAASLSLVSCNATGGGVCGGSGNNLTVSFSSLANGASATITVVATVSALVAPATVVLNTASVSSPVDDFNLSNNSYTLGLFVQQIQNISFQAPSNQQLGAPPVSVSASANSGLAVNFNSQTSSVCTVSGTSVTLLAIGTCTIQAIQGGNFEYAAATPVSQSFQVLPPATTTALSVSPSPAVFGSKVALKATISLPSATGTVTFYDSGTILGVEPVSAGVATLNTTLLPSGVSNLSARYAGGGANPGASSLSATQQETVNAGVVDAYNAASGSPVGTGTSPVWVAVADFNNDGIQDLAVINQANNTVGIFLGNGSGGFTPSGSGPFAVGNHASALATGDFNGDGNTDLVITNNADNTVTVLLGNGSGSFTAPSGSPFAVGQSPNSVAVADFNGDGYADLAVANTGDTAVTLLLGNGSGNFAPSSTSPIALGRHPTFLIVGDFNNDGNADLAVASHFANNVSILLGNGNGGFSAPVGSPFAVGNGPAGLALGDFNGDGKQDLAVTNNTDNTVSILQGNGDGTFTSLMAVAVSVHPASIAVGDLNGDGKTDLAVSGQTGSRNLTILFGNGSGGFAAATPTPFSAGITAQCVAIGDFNGDGKPDLAVANSGSNNLSILLGVDNPTQLKITQAPSNGTAGVPIGNVVVQVQDTAGNLMTGSTAAVTIASTPSGVNGTLTVNAQGGVATFSGLVFYSPHTYTLAASAIGLVSALTNVVVAASPSGTPGIVSASPTPATGLTNTFQLAYSDTGGNASLTQVGVNFGAVANSPATCLVWYHPATNTLFLVNDAGTASSQITPGSGTLSNSQCSINGSGTSVVRSGTNLTLNLSVTASSTYTGKHNIFMYATDTSSVSTAWLNEGTWTPAANQPPVLVSAAENPPSSLSTTFTLTYSDPNGATDLNTVKVLLGSSVTTANTCLVWYVASTNLVFLENNAGNGTTTLTPGSGTLSNSQCSINGSGTSVQRSGNNLVLTLAVTVTSAATKNVYMNAVDNSAAAASWTKIGTWTP